MIAGDSPAAFADLTVAGWFEERVRPLVRADPVYREGTWEDALALPDEDALAAAERDGLVEGAPVRVTLSGVAAVRAGFPASVVAAGVVRDGVLIRVSRPGALRGLVHPDDWFTDAALDNAEVAVPAGHPWEGREGVEVVAGDALLAEAAAEIRRAAEPAIELIAVRSGRGRAGLWAQVSDAVAWATEALVGQAPAVDREALVAATSRLLQAPGRPWKQVPTQWVAPTDGDPVVVTHRGSCCLWYQCDLEALAEPAGDDPYQRALRERFGEDDIRYCATCLHRKPEDVQARVCFVGEFLASSRG